jgi:integrase
MKEMTFSGPLKREIAEYLRFRHAVGFAWVAHGNRYIFGEFDRFLQRAYSRSRIVTRPMVVDYLSTTTHLHSTSRSLRVTLVRGLCRYLYQSDPRHYVPEPRLLPSGSRKLKPYIYSGREIAEIICQLRKAKTRRPIRRGAPRVTETWAACVGLLAATGMRSGEVRRLNIDDVDLENRVLTIRRSKFFKSRLVPISKSTADALARYRRRRLMHDWRRRRLDPTTAPFFIGWTGNRITTTVLSMRFRRVVRAMGLKSASGDWARLHDLRHTFATRWMEDLYRAGRDPNGHLPILATYLGHVNLDYTQKYLHATPKLLARAGKIFDAYSHRRPR